MAPGPPRLVSDSRRETGRHGGKRRRDPAPPAAPPKAAGVPLGRAGLARLAWPLGVRGGGGQPDPPCLVPG
eukprot:854384-Lingulodinium_polyedra.AAC.1